MELYLDILSWILLGSGAVFGVISGIGMLRFPDFYSRVHAAGISDTLVAMLILSGLALQADSMSVIVRLGMILLFILITSPVSTHALVRSAMLHKLKPWERKEGDKS